MLVADITYAQKLLLKNWVDNLSLLITEGGKLIIEARSRSPHTSEIFQLRITRECKTLWGEPEQAVVVVICYCWSLRNIESTITGRANEQRS